MLLLLAQRMSLSIQRARMQPRPELWTCSAYLQLCVGQVACSLHTNRVISPAVYNLCGVLRGEHTFLKRCGKHEGECPPGNYYAATQTFIESLHWLANCFGFSKQPPHAVLLFQKAWFAFLFLTGSHLSTMSFLVD
ncbi:hypothetical protein BDP55DRAFT_147911 [Colletotrichum godetiae]|uniref:Uncharacterized protein n=1 Tax=Colletotrichum godetiae TaxID=1209918 RepID=A0AAJ0AKS1_9PEZI|nr:uncharacterized protein BDP55DRAFT_147911 [Colletotrichum godetiae]KAK1675708.1 hypothetical protein BDP55DRAFT_147911 [Colletotrichum godetiae]